MKSHTVNIPALAFRASVVPATVDDDARTVELTWSTGAGVERYDWATGQRFLEVLSMDPKHVRLARLNSGAPVLDSHSSWSLGDVLGVIEQNSGRIEKGLGVARARFSQRDDVAPKWRDIRDGITPNVSVGYRVYKFVETLDQNGGIPTRTAVDWEPFEVSIVPMPADVGAQVRAADKTNTNPCVIVTRDAEGEPMLNEQNQTGQPAAEPTVAERTVPAAGAPDAEQIRAQGQEMERTRQTAIRDAVRVAGLDGTVADEFCRGNQTIDQVRASIFDRLAERSASQTVRNQTVEVGEASRDKFVRGVSNWLIRKGGFLPVIAQAERANADQFDPGEFRGMSLLDIAKESLTRAGVSFRGLDKMEVAALAFTRSFGSQGVSDFAIALESVLNKVLQAAYMTQPDTWSRFCAQTTLTDFRPHTRYRMGSIATLDSLNDLGEFKNKALSDAEKASITAATKGNIVSISRQTVVNDDIGFVMNIMAMLGRAAKRSPEVDVYALLALNSGLGPTMSDGNTLFHATHNNIATTTAISAAGFDVDRVTMASQKDKDGHDYIDMRPAVLVLPVGLGGQARVINQSQYDPDTLANKGQMKPNVVVGLFRDIVDTPRMSGTRRYAFADPQIAPTIEVGFIDGQSEPVLETQAGWRVDGSEMRVRYDYGVAATDFRGAVTNAG